MSGQLRLSQMPKNAGTVASWHPMDLRALMPQELHFPHSSLQSGSENNYGAGVFLLNEDLALIQTVGLCIPMLDDPYLFGAIAAANAFGEIYAKGATPLTAFNVAAFPLCEDKSVFTHILQGGADKINEAGALLVGSHTVADNEPKYGLAITGSAHPRRIISASNACAGDLLFLTKPLGVGIIITALKKGAVKEAEIMPVLKSMAELNKTAAGVMVKCGVKGGTVIAGGGLLGHLSELTAASGLLAELWLDFIPFHAEAKQLALHQYAPEEAYRNLQYLQDKVRFAPQVAECQHLLLADPQISGGLLISAPKRIAGSVEGELEQAGLDYAIIGKMHAGHGIDVMPA